MDPNRFDQRRQVMIYQKIPGILTLLLTLTTYASAEDFVLVQDGQPKAQLVLSAAPSDTERAAASDLQNYIQKISGAVIPIVETNNAPEGPAVLIGHSETVKSLVGFLLSEENFGYDGFLVKTFPNRLVVAGRDTKSPEQKESEYDAVGTRYAAFALLEELGCRFFSPEPDGEYLPQTTTLTVGDVHIVSKPDFLSRWIKPNKYNRNTFTEQTAQQWESWYLKIRQGGINLPTGHNYDAMVPPRLFDEHPEYFAYERQSNKRTARYLQPCLSNPKVLEMTVAYCRKFLDQRPTAWGVSLSPADEPGWCECDNCRALDHPDPAIGVAARVLGFNNRVAQEVTKTHPGILFPYYAEYTNMPGPPVHPDGTIALMAHPAVVPAMVNRFCYLHDINDPACWLNAEYRRRLEAWQRVSQHRVMHEYFNHNFDAPRLPTGQNWMVGPRIKYYRDLGILGFHGEVLVYGPDNILNTYIASRMLWNADQDPDALIDEYWNTQGHPQTSIGWYRVNMAIPPDLGNRKLLLYFGAVDLFAHIWINGQEVTNRFAYKLQEAEPFSVDITPYVKPGQDNLIVVRAQDYESRGGIWKSVMLVSPKP